MKQRICTKCTNQISVNDNDSFVACPKCFSYHEVSESGIKFVSIFKNSNRPQEVCFELGQNIKVNGSFYTITGITQRNDATYKSFKWREYNLKSAINEDAFLNEYAGTWLLVKPLSVPPSLYVKGDTSIKHEDTKYNIFQTYKQEISWAIGNFDFDISDVSKLYSREFISPPKMLIYEVQKTLTESKPEWYEGEYVEAEDIYQEYLRLGNKTTFPPKYRVGATEPYKSQFYREDASKMSLIALAVILAIQLYFMATSPTKTVFRETFSVTDLKFDSSSTNLTSPKPIVSKTFSIDKTGKIEIELSTGVDNSWLESNITMVNESTLEELPIVLGSEYYHGYEGGENWTEGSTSASKDYSEVPAGKYHLLIETTTPSINGGTYEVKLQTGGIYWVNIFIILCLIAILPIIKYFQEYNFEKERWADSDYSPYNHNEA
ncbi:MAG: DUF4178 domain-containing protein [Emticicia sp.]|nr:DUF4178 domain-containing protein [Emticicia sp.]